jgi:hypothetical protein
VNYFIRGFFAARSEIYGGIINAKQNNQNFCDHGNVCGSERGADVF